MSNSNEIKNHVSALRDESADSVVRATLRRRVLEYRADHDLTQRQFSEIAKVSRTTVQRIEACKSVAAISQIKVYRIVSDSLL